MVASQKTAGEKTMLATVSESEAFITLESRLNNIKNSFITIDNLVLCYIKAKSVEELIKVLTELQSKITEIGNIQSKAAVLVSELLNSHLKASKSDDVDDPYYNGPYATCKEGEKSCQ